MTQPVPAPSKGGLKLNKAAAREQGIFATVSQQSRGPHLDRVHTLPRRKRSHPHGLHIRHSEFTIHYSHRARLNKEIAENLAKGKLDG